MISSRSCERAWTIEFNSVVHLISTGVCAALENCGSGLALERVARATADVYCRCPPATIAAMLCSLDLMSRMLLNLIGQLMGHF